MAVLICLQQRPQPKSKKMNAKCRYAAMAAQMDVANAQNVVAGMADAAAAAARVAVAAVKAALSVVPSVATAA